MHRRPRHNPGADNRPTKYPDPGVTTDNPITFEYVINASPRLEPDGTKPTDESTEDCGGSGGSPGAMTTYAIHLLLASLHLHPDFVHAATRTGDKCSGLVYPARS